MVVQSILNHHQQLVVLNQFQQNTSRNFEKTKRYAFWYDQQTSIMEMEEYYCKSFIILAVIFDLDEQAKTSKYLPFIEYKKCFSYPKKLSKKRQRQNSFL